MVPHMSMLDNGIKVKKERFRLGKSKNLLLCEDRGAAGQTPGETAKSPSLEIFKLKLNRVLRSLS